MNLHPKGNMVMLEAIIEAKTTKGGIILPEKSRNVLNQGIILELGESVDGTYLKVGEMVIFPLHSEYRVTHDDKDLVFILDNQILAGSGDPVDLNQFKQEQEAEPTPPPFEKKRPLGRCTCFDTAINPKCPLHGDGN